MAQFAKTEKAENMVISALTAIEGRSVLCRLRKGSTLPPSQAALAVSALDAHIGRMIQQPSNSRVVDEARELVDRYNLKALDAIQLASAVVVRDLMGAPDMRFITSDKELLIAAKAEGFDIWDPAA